MKFETRTREYKNDKVINRINEWENLGWIVSKLMRSKNPDYELTVIVVFMRQKDEEYDGGW